MVAAAVPSDAPAMGALAGVAPTSLFCCGDGAREVHYLGCYRVYCGGGILAVEAVTVAATSFFAVPFAAVAATAKFCVVSTVAAVVAALLDVSTTAAPAPLPAVSATAASALILVFSAATVAAAFPAVAADARVAATATRAAIRAFLVEATVVIAAWVAFSHYATSHASALVAVRTVDASARLAIPVVLAAAATPVVTAVR